MRAIVQSGACAVLSVLAWNAYALDIWHYGTLPITHHRCEATFMLDAGRNTFRDVKIRAIAKDKQSQVLDRFELKPEDMGVDGRNRFASATWISPHACEPEVTILLKSATAMVDGLHTDLLATQQLRLQQMEPLAMRLPQSRERP